MLLPPIAFAQREASVDRARRPPRYYSSLRHSPRKRENHWAPSRVIVARNRPKYVWATILLTLSIFLITTTIIQSATSSVPVARSDSLVAVPGANSFAYSGQWASYGGPITPNGVAVDSSGNVFIADAKNYAVYKLANDGSFSATWGSQGSGPSHFNNPEGIALDPQGNVYVSDSVNNNIQKFSPAGGFITSWGSTGSGNGQFKTPLGLSVNASGFVYAVDQGNQRVEIFRNDGTYVGSFGGLGTIPGKFISPYGVVVDSSGFVYVSDNARSSGNITKFTKTGGLVFAWGGLNSGTGSLAGPAMMAVDNAGNIYVSDNSFNHVEKFGTTSGNLILSWGSS